MPTKTTPFSPLSADLSSAKSPTAELTAGLVAPLSEQEFDELEAILDTLRERDEEVPGWEFCEGFLAALVVCRRTILPSEYLPILLGTPDDANDTQTAVHAFTSTEQAHRFMELWLRRSNHVAQCLSKEIDNLADEGAYTPEVLDVRSAVAALPEAERQQLADQTIPSFAQIWALGFMFAVENWPEEWQLPRDKEIAQHIDAALQDIIALTEDDTDPPQANGDADTTTENSDDSPPLGMSQQRVDAFANAMWAVYDLFALWKEVGPRVATLQKSNTPGRNDPCFCGSGKKYKKCHGG